MIFSFHDNSDGDDDNAFCIVMLMKVSGVIGRSCEESQHSCPPCWLWTFFCPQCLSGWWMPVDLKALSFCPPSYMFLSISRFLCVSPFRASSCFMLHFSLLVLIDLWGMWPFGTSSFLYFCHLPLPLISQSDFAPYFHITPLSFFVSFLLSAVNIKHRHQIDSHVNKAAVGG